MGTEQYIGVPIAVHTAGGHDRFAVTKQPPFLRVLPDVLAQMVAEADRFRTLDAHVARLHDKGWPAEATSVFREDYRRLAEMGYMRSWSGFVASAAERAQKAGPAPIAWVVWPTRNRRDVLVRSLESWAAASREHGRTMRFLICDDSTTDVAAGIRTAAVEVADRIGVEVHYAGAAEREAFVAALASAGVPEAAARFALFDVEGLGDPYNITRNAALLATTGETFLSTDDDTLCRFALPHDPRPGLRLYSYADPTDISFYESREQVLAAARFVDEDPWQAHERMLGRTVESLMTGAALEIDTGGLEPVFADYLAGGRGRVAVTSAGACGNSGMTSSRIVLRLRGPMRERLSDASRYVAAATSAEVLNAVNQETIGFLPTFMAMSFGCDNRLPLPPFFPAKRAADGLWATTLRVCADDALVAHIPRAVLHAPPEPRRVTREAARGYTPGLSETLRAVVCAFPVREGIMDPATRTTQLGKFLIETASLDWQDLERVLKESWVEDNSRNIDYLEGLLLRYERSPKPWAEDVEAHIEALRRYAESDRFGIPYDLGDRSPEAVRVLLTRLVRRYGELLAAWPEIVSVARDLRRKGIALARPLTQ